MWQQGLLSAAAKVSRRRLPMMGGLSAAIVGAVVSTWLSAMNA